MRQVRADVVLALHDLFVYCARQSIPAVHVEGFQEIPQLLTRRIEAVTFDMDGTLVDSLGSITDAFNHMFARLGYPSMTMEEVIRHTSISLMDFVKTFLKPEEAEKGVRVFREYYDAIFLEKTTMIPGAMETLSALNGTTLQGVVTNKRGKYARMLAEHLGFAQNMARIIGAEDGFKAKPAGEMFEEFIRSVGSAKDKTIYVGDAPLDIQAAKNAGIDAFAVASSIFSAEELAMHRPRQSIESHYPTARSAPASDIRVAAELIAFTIVVAHELAQGAGNGKIGSKPIRSSPFGLYPQGSKHGEAHVCFLRTCVPHKRGLHGSGELGYGPRGRGAFRIHVDMGPADVQRDGGCVADPVRETRHRCGKGSRTSLSGQLSSPDKPCALDSH